LLHSGSPRNNQAIEADMLMNGCSFVRDRRGQDLIEYALVTGLVSVLSMVLGHIVRGL
jgi:hypothetical protein